MIPVLLAPNVLFSQTMSVNRFEDLRVWEAAKDQCDRIGALIRRPFFEADPELASQMNDASISVLFNISEGFLRRRDKETAQFLRYSISSNGELKSGYYAADGRQYVTRSERDDLIALNESIAKMLHRWMGTLDIDENRRKRGPGTKDQGRTKDPGRTGDQRPRTKD